MTRQSGGPSLADDLEFARRLAAVAGELALEFFQRGVVTQRKPDGSPVSEADVAVERRLRELISAERPGDGVQGEELGETGSRERRWVLDPIDGTSNFVARRPLWGTHVALEVEGEIVVGVITRPVLGASWWASRGGGAFRGGAGAERQLRVSGVNRLAETRVTLWTHSEDPSVERLTQSCRWMHPTLDSLLRVAEGELDALIDRSGAPWDIAPAGVFVEEAGGHFSDRDGGRRLDLRDSCFSNGLIHGDLARLLRAP
jgi:histidinol-phosphatase